MSSCSFCQLILRIIFPEDTCLDVGQVKGKKGKFAPLLN
jgi:hypothetical protein